MADDKKKGPPAPPSPFGKDHHKEVIYFLLPGLFVLSLLLGRLVALLNSLEYSVAGTFWSRFVLGVLHFWSLWKGVAVLLCVLALVVFVYSFIKLRELNKEEEKIYGHAPEDTFLEHGPGDKRENPKWQKIVEHANSNNPAEWRVAIIEADIMLDELLKALGYDGEGVGEMLKKVEPSDMLTLDQAWEAHKIRNRIAHAGQEFDLSERETQRVIKLFEEVFKEYQII